jgi:hypothetical protein
LFSRFNATIRHEAPLPTEYGVYFLFLQEQIKGIIISIKYIIIIGEKMPAQFQPIPCLRLLLIRSR